MPGDKANHTVEAGPLLEWKTHSVKSKMILSEYKAFVAVIIPDMLQICHSLLFIVPPAHIICYVFTLFAGEEVRDRDLTIVKHRTHRKFLQHYHGIDILQSHLTDDGERKFKFHRVWKGMKGSEAAYCAFIKAAQSAKAQSLADGVRATQPTTHPEGMYVYM